MHAAARLKGWPEVRRLFEALAVRTQLKRNGLRSICDPRHSAELSTMAITEATSGQTSGIREALVQDYRDHVRIFPFLAGGQPQGSFRFAGLRTRGGFVLAGVTYSIRRDADGRVRCRSVDLRDASPRAAHPGDWDDFDPPVLFYPEDPPAGQSGGGGTVFLGMPACQPADQSDQPLVRRAFGLCASQDWRAAGRRARQRPASSCARDPQGRFPAGDPFSLARGIAGASASALEW